MLLLLGSFTSLARENHFTLLLTQLQLIHSFNRILILSISGDCELRFAARKLNTESFNDSYFDKSANFNVLSYPFCLAHEWY